MRELLPIAIGIVVAAAAVHVTGRRARLPLLAVGCVVAGALASWVNGELSSSIWDLFVSFDALQAWLGAACYLAASRAFAQRYGPREL
jgi:hypothetical protein